MYRKFLLVASLVLPPTAHAQTPDRTILRHIAVDYAIGGTARGTTTERGDLIPILHINGERALVGQVKDSTRPAEPRSSFKAEVRGDVISSAWGEAEFGAVQNPDRSSGAFVVSLGVCSQRGAILLTQRNGSPLEVGRYRISEGANEPGEILALVLTGSPTRPTGTFRGESGWLVVTAASDRLLAGRFQFDAVGFLAAEPDREDRQVHVTGSLSAAAASSSFRVCQDAE
jgi:hypothetical protein